MDGVLKQATSSPAAHFNTAAVAQSATLRYTPRGMLTAVERAPGGLALRVPTLLLAGVRQAGAVKTLVRLMMFVLFSGPAVLPAPAAFSSLYVFGDGVCSSTDNPNGGSIYYPYTYCNGPVWVQGLAQRQGLTYDASKNLSYFGHYSALLVTHVNQFSPTDANTALFVVWVNDADFVYNMQYLYPDLSLASWNSAMNGFLANHYQAITNLYAKGARTLILPNAVDITKIP